MHPYYNMAKHTGVQPEDNQMYILMYSNPDAKTNLMLI